MRSLPARRRTSEFPPRQLRGLCSSLPPFAPYKRAETFAERAARILNRTRVFLIRFQQLRQTLARQYRDAVKKGSKRDYAGLSGKGCRYEVRARCVSPAKQRLSV